MKTKPIKASNVINVLQVSSRVHYAPNRRSPSQSSKLFSGDIPRNYLILKLPRRNLIGPPRDERLRLFLNWNWNRERIGDCRELLLLHIPCRRSCSLLQREWERAVVDGLSSHVLFMWKMLKLHIGPWAGLHANLNGLVGLPFEHARNCFRGSLGPW